MAEKKSGSEKLLYCSFCGKSQHEVKKLIAGPSVFICDECIELCNDIVRDEIAGEQGAGAQAPEPERAAGALAEPGVGQLQVGQPGGPTGVFKTARAVAAAEQVDLHHRKAGLGQGTGLAGGGAARGVELFGERWTEQHPAARRCPGGR